MVILHDQPIFDILFGKISTQVENCPDEQPKSCALEIAKKDLAHEFLKVSRHGVTLV